VFQPESDEGLPDNNVCGVAQTPDGYLWVATHGGLVRFDGERFQEFSAANSSNVVHSFLMVLVMFCMRPSAFTGHAARRIAGVG
jgi:ligand-binding sensor domain-containing protein